MFHLGKHFYSLWSSQVLSQTAVNILHFILLLELYERTQSNFVVGILVVILSVCPIIFSGIAGVIADRYNRRIILMSVNISRALILVLMILTDQWPALILILAFVFTAIAQFFPPTESASIPELVSRDKLVTANSLFTFTLYGSFLLGYMIAGPILELVELDGVLLILAALFGIATFQNYQLPNLTSHLNPAESLGPELSLRETWRRLGDGFRFIFTDSLLLPLILLVSLLFGLERGAASLVPDITKRILFYSNIEISFYLILPLGVGTVIGVVIMNWLKRKIHKSIMILAGALLEALVFSAFLSVNAFPSHQTFLILMFSFLIGLGDVFIIVGTQTLIQERMGTEIRGRAFGVVITAVNVIGLPVILLLSYLGNKVNIVHLLSFSGILALFFVFIASGYLYWKQIFEFIKGGLKRTLFG